MSIPDQAPQQALTQVWTLWVCFNSVATFVPQLGHWSMVTVAWIVPWPGLVAVCSLIVTGTLQAAHIRWAVDTPA